MSVHPVQQNRTQAYSYGSSAQHMSASISQNPQPPSGYPSISAGPSCFRRYHADTNVHAPTRYPAVHVVPPRAFSLRINGGSTQVEDQYYNLRSMAHPQTQTQAYGQPLSISPVYATPVEAVSPVNDPIFCVSPYFPPAILTAFSDTPNFRPLPSGLCSNIVDEPTGPSQRVGPKYNDEKYKEQEPEPSQRLIPSAARKTRPVSYEGDVVRLQQRCREKGADESVIPFLGKIFADEVSLEALVRPVTDAEVETKEFGIETGKVYTAFLKYTNETSVDPRFICRLCHVQSKQTWKNSKDVLRHLRRDHFGLSDVCKQCGHKFYTKGELTRHPCKPLNALGSLVPQGARCTGAPCIWHQIPVSDSPVHPAAGRTYASSRHA